MITERRPLVSPLSDIEFIAIGYVQDVHLDAQIDDFRLRICKHIRRADHLAVLTIRIRQRHGTDFVRVMLQTVLLLSAGSFGCAMESGPSHSRETICLVVDARR